MSSLKTVELSDSGLVWRWDRRKLRSAWLQQGAYLLRTNLTQGEPETLWRYYLQLTEVESIFRTLKSELNVRPIWHRLQPRIEAHILIAFLGYCLARLPLFDSNFGYFEALGVCKWLIFRARAVRTGLQCKRGF